MTNGILLWNIKLFFSFIFTFILNNPIIALVLYRLLGQCIRTFPKFFALGPIVFCEGFCLNPNA